MKIALFTNNYLPRISGVAVAVDFVDRALKKQGHQTFVIAPDYGFDSRVPGVDLHRVTSISIQKFTFALALQDLEQERILGIVEGFQPAVIHSHHPFLLGEAAARAADEFRIPLVYTFHTPYDVFTQYFKLDFPAVRRKVREFVSNYANQCDLVIAPTRPIQDYLVGMGVTSRLATVPTGLDGERFRHPSPGRIRALRKHYGLEGFESVLLYVGRITKEKNVQLCLATLDELIRRGRNCCLLIFGEGPDSENLEKEARERGLHDRLVLGGFLDQTAIADAYRLGSVFLFPSMSDTQGIVLYEARASGLPVVATDSMASRAILRPRRNGLFARPEPGDFADRVEQILDRPERFNEPFPLDDFSPARLGSVYERLFSEVASRGRRPRPPRRKRFKDLVEEIGLTGRNTGGRRGRRSRLAPGAH